MPLASAGIATSGIAASPASAGSSPGPVQVASGTPSVGLSILVALAGQPSVGLSISVVDPQVFDTGSLRVTWYARVMIGETDVSERLTGEMKIIGAENAARVAEFEVAPASAAELATYESAALTIDITLFRAGQASTFRRFTGKVEAIELSEDGRIAGVTARDGYQERPKACASAAEVEALFGGLAYPSGLVTWSDEQPAPAAYFSSLMETMQGCCAIDAAGLWRAIPWAIGAPAATFRHAEDGYLDGTVAIRLAQRADLPTSIDAALAIRYARLHAVEKALSWEAVGYDRYVIDGLPTLPKSTVVSALGGVSGWFVKGSPTLVEPTPGDHPVLVGGQTQHYVVSFEAAAITCQSFEATMYHRWYQEVQANAKVTIALGGSSERDSAISESLLSEWTASDWENVRSSNAITGIYKANAPASAGGAAPTGYEGLPAPWPAANSGMDWRPDIEDAELQAAVRATVAKAVRTAAAGLRGQYVEFVRPIDPRWEIGAVLGLESQHVQAVGQLVEFEDTLDHDSGAVLTKMRLACPAAAGTVTGFTASLTIPPAEVAHALPAVVLTNCIGASGETPADPDEDTLLGFLCNVLPTGNNYNAERPVYEEQFRIVLPEIPAELRDPLQFDVTIDADISIAGGVLVIDY